MPDEPSAAPPPQDQPDSPPVPPAGLVLVSTPIGNLGDITMRARAALAAADLVLCEDTRHTGGMLAALGVSARMQALHEHNEDAAIPALLARLAQGQRVALVSDAGTPLLSDPGFRLTRAAIAAGAAVTAIPGPNAALTALVLSGLPPLPFLMLGFPPTRAAARRAEFGRLRAAERAGLSATLIWHEAPHRLAEMLADLAGAFGDRPAAVARELTKRFEEVRRTGLSALAGHYATAPPRGEITVVVGPSSPEQADAEDLDGRLRAALAGHSVKDAAALVATATGLPRRLVYTRALTLADAGADAGGDVEIGTEP
ncbi:MAG TPA: 16S rRNA (cytidine(1402)-2'-O)-methyltransferase [Acetobacteraceae bacterium]|jgi:16S rRNA (cytidine1402-2'-O)-methyltransferase|nr:16S rRNA (cytidine(1402)-2'-O)-methyltransferase [Acetobacteraceae bacterium]